MAHLLSRLDPGRSPDQVLVSNAREALTLEGLAARTTSVAKLIEALGLRTLALHMDNRPDWVIIDLACQLTGVCLVPLPTFFSSTQLQHVLDTVPIDAVFTEQPEYLATLCAGRIRPGPDLAIGGCELLLLDRLEPAAALPAESGKVTFTSGSTGKPKGVCLSHAQLLAQAAALAGTVGLEAPRHLCLLPLSTLLENIAGVYTPLLAGGEVIIPTLAEVGFTGSSSLNPQVLLALLDRQQPHSIILTPQLLQLLVSAAEAGWAPPPSLAFVAVGGSKVSAGLLNAAQAVGLPAFEGYGLSECASVVSLNVPGSNRPGSCGRPLAHLGVEIDSGEIVVRGNAMLGYAGEPASWRPDAIRTGDLGYFDEDGFLFINGRSKNLLISSYGRNISPEWVESELLADPCLAECVVFGDARPYCVALLLPRDPTTSDAAIQRTIDRSNARLPDYARVRQWYRLDQSLADGKGLLTENGRPRRAAILARFGAAIDSLYTPQANARIA